ncbi:MAG: putative Ig domain-containing protein [Myxococcota bacterium]
MSRHHPPCVRPLLTALALAALLAGAAPAEAQLDPHVGGQWGPVIDWPHVAVSMANLPDGRVLTFSSNERDRFPQGPEFSYAAVFDPSDGSFVEIPHPAHDMFCASLVMLEDGHVFVSGGRNQADSPWTSLFDFRTDSWIPIEDMNRGRWYPTSVALPTGQVFIAVGIGGEQHPEIWTPGQGWQLLTGIDLTGPILDYGSRDGGRMWPLIQLDPDGTLVHHGATEIMHRMTPTGLGQIEVLGPHGADWFPDEGTSVMYEPGKILVSGGSIAINDSTSSNKAMVIDVNGPGPVVTPIAPMNSARQFHNEIMLPNGDVLMVGGNTNGVKFNDDAPVFAPEVWRPATGAWTSYNPQQIPRTYHSTAVLLTDGTVLSAGGGLSGNSAVNHWDGEIFSPPYLFDSNDQPAVRPVITGGPDVIRVGRTFDLQATAGMDRFTLVKMSATTHTMNTDQRFLEVAFGEGAPGEYSLSLESNENVLTPGFWMLFALDAGGVPSVSKVVQIVTSGTPRATAPADPRHTVGETVSLTLEAGDPDGDALTFAATGLPDGLSLDPATGEISGTPTRSGIYTVAVVVDDGSDAVGIGFRWFVAAPAIHSEVGHIDIAQSGPDPWHPVSFQNLYIDPVVVVGPPTHHDSAPTTVRVRNVTPEGFEVQLDEWDYQDGAHGSETLAYLVVEAGAQIVDGSQALVAGMSEGVSEAWTTQPLPAGAFTAPPIVLTQIVTAGHWEASATRLQNVGTESFEVRLQQQEQGDGLVGSERVHWVALEPGALAGGLQADLTPALSVGETPDAISFSPSFSGAPRFLARAQTFFGGDTMTLRHQNLGASGVEVWVDEETSKDSEQNHGNNETVGWLAIDPSLDELSLVALFNADPSIEDPGAQAGVEGEDVALVFQVDDPDGDPVSFQATGLPPGLVLDPVLGRIEGQLGSAGTFDVTATVTDARGASAQVGFQWTVLEQLELALVASPPRVAGADVDFTASPNIGDPLEYVWDFGDGTPPTDPSGSISTSHSFAGPGRYVVTLTATEPSTGMQDTLQFVQVVHAQAAALPAARSTSIAYEAGADRVWVANPDNDSVSVFDALSDLELAEIPVGDGPRSVAFAPDGQVWVTNKDSATISRIDPAGLEVDSTLELPGASRPHGLVFSPDGAAAFVALEALGEVHKLHPTSGALLGSAGVGAYPRHLAVTPDAATLLVSRYITPPQPGESTDSPQTQILGAPVGGEVVPVDTASLAVAAPLVLAHSEAPLTEQSGPGVPNFLGAAAVSPDGATAFVPSKQDNILGGRARDGIDLDHDSTVRAIVSKIDLATGTEDLLARVDHDNASISSASAFSRTGAYLFTALEGNRAVAIVDPYGGAELGRFGAGRAPQGLALSPDGRTLYVHNFMDRTVTVHDLSGLLDFDVALAPIDATWDLVANEALPANVLNGKQLFYDAFDTRLSLESYMACAACHNDGGHDGRTWDFTQFGEGLRNTIELTGHGDHGPLHWTANFDEIQDFEGQIRFFGGTGLMSDADFFEGTRSDPLGDPKAGLSGDLDDLAAYVESLDTAHPSPHRESDGALTADGLDGRTIFILEGCGDCHGGAAFSDSPDGGLHDVGTLTSTSGPQTALDTPTLRGLWGSAPYLHDGSADTLEDAIAAHEGVDLSPAALALLASYLDQVDGSESSAPLMGTACGLGFEVGLALPVLVAWRLRRRRGRGRRPEPGAAPER